MLSTSELQKFLKKEVISNTGNVESESEKLFQSIILKCLIHNIKICEKEILTNEVIQNDLINMILKVSNFPKYFNINDEYVSDYIFEKVNELVPICWFAFCKDYKTSKKNAL